MYFVSILGKKNEKKQSKKKQKKKKQQTNKNEWQFDSLYIGKIPW